MTHHFFLLSFSSSAVCKSALPDKIKTQLAQLVLISMKGTGRVHSILHNI